MTRDEALLQKMLNLPAEEHADVAEELLANLEGLPAAETEETEREWGAEIERRARRVLAGESPGVPWEEVKRSDRSRLTER